MAGKRTRIRSLALCIALGTLVCIALGVPSSGLSDESETEKESFYQQLSRVVIRLEETVPVDRSGRTKTRPVGTAFFVKFDDRTFLVSARHVADRPNDLHARVASRRLDTGETEVMELRIPADAWVFHRQDQKKIRVGSRVHVVAAIDVAAVMIPNLKEGRVIAIEYCPDPCPEGGTQQFADADPEPPEMVLVFGFPADVGFSLLEQRPIGRLGIISMATSEPFLRRQDGLLMDSRVVLVDAPIFGGNSGGPVFQRPENRKPLVLLGLISATNSTLSYAVAEPVSRISEAVEYARKEGEPQPPPTWDKLP